MSKIRLGLTAAVFIAALIASPQGALGETFSGTGGNDELSVTVSGGTYTVSLGGTALGSYTAAQLNNSTFNGAGGQDAITVTVNDDGAQLQLWSHRVTVTLGGQNCVLSLINIKNVKAVGNGTNDVAFMYDTQRNDYFTGGESLSRLSDSTDAGQETYSIEVEDFRYAHGYATAGGFDTAVLTDSNGFDEFLSYYPGTALIYNGNFQSRARYFEKITAVSTGGDDAAYFYDSPGDDIFAFNSHTQTATMGTGETAHRAHDFRWVHAYAAYGGSDQANLTADFDETDPAQWFCKAGEYCKLFGADYYVRLKYVWAAVRKNGLLLP